MHFKWASIIHHYIDILFDFGGTEGTLRVQNGLLSRDKLFGILSVIGTKRTMIYNILIETTSFMHLKSMG